MNPSKAVMIATAMTFIGGASAAEASTVYTYDANTTYTNFADSPFAGQGGSSTFWLEDFEDGLVNQLGLSMTGGEVGLPSSWTDSVDGDGTGTMDGSGADGHAFKATGFQQGGPNIMIEFDANALGQLPTMAGLVWTDGNDASPVTFEAFDAQGVSLGSMTANLGDGVHNGSTAADRFLGLVFQGGISALNIYGEFGGMELDHVQYGYAASVVPLPPAAIMGLAGLGLIAARRRKLRSLNG